MHCKYFDCQKCSFYLWHISHSCTTVLLAAMSCKHYKTCTSCTSKSCWKYSGKNGTGKTRIATINSCSGVGSLKNSIEYPWGPNTLCCSFIEIKKSVFEEGSGVFRGYWTLFIDTDTQRNHSTITNYNQ